MRKTTAAVLAGLSTAALVVTGAPAAYADGEDPAGFAAASTVGDVPSDYTGEDLAEDVVIEDIEGELLAPEDKPRRVARSAAGSTAIGSFSYSVGGTTISIPTGCFMTHSIKGSGKRINRQIAGVDCVGPSVFASRFCNTRFEFHYADTRGKTYKIQRGPLLTKCHTGTVPVYTFSKAHTLPKYGKACAQLFVNGSRKAVQCHYITK
ncbi:hypothetical protein GCM10023329_55220 [Streptomyces sanyensis]|uniref:Secreted protein n=1 Tax=Streptomyces sanyensis TaxID=568869 RepID=A0ABP9BHJ9_9ACTN